MKHPLRVHRALIRILLTAALGGASVLAGVPSVSAQPAGMPDPRMMSGISRVDPSLEAGSVSVRVLLGGFSEPAIGKDVQLELFDAADTSLGTLQLQSDEVGRVTFTGLSAKENARYGIARVTFENETQETQRIVLDARAGSRVLLVRGAPSRAGAGGRDTPTESEPGAGMANPHVGGGHAAVAPGAQAPALCRPNALDTHPDGTLVVGVIDFSPAGTLDGRGDQTVTLEVRAPGEAVRTLEAKTQADGRATFESLAGAGFPTGTEFLLRAASDSTDAPPAAVTGGARGDASIPAGTVRIQVVKPGAAELRSQPFIWDQKAAVVLLTKTCLVSATQPVADVTVELQRHTMTGETSSVSATADVNGIVEIVPDTPNDGDFYSVHARFEGAPFRGSFFELPPRVGVRVEFPVYEITDDPSVVRSAVQYQYQVREDNLVQVVRYYQVFVTGSRAFWWPDGLKLEGPEDTRWFQVIPGSESMLDHKEGAPYATLSEPILPGQPIDLSVAYGVPHDGERQTNWTSPFPLERALGVLENGLVFTQGAVGPVEPAANGPALASQMSTLSVSMPGPTLCNRAGASKGCEQAGGATLRLRVGGLAYERPWLVVGGIVLASVMGLGLLFGLTRHSQTPLQRLIRRRDRLWSHLESAKKSGDLSRVETIQSQLNELYYRIEAHLGGSKKP